jgi:hypothetical protein
MEILRILYGFTGFRGIMEDDNRFYGYLTLINGHTEEF